MDLVDSFVPSFKRKAPEAQSFVELKKLEEPSNIQFVDVPIDSNIISRDSIFSAPYNNNYEYHDYHDPREIGTDDKKEEDVDDFLKQKQFQNRKLSTNKASLRKAPRSEESEFVSTLNIEPMVVKNSKFDEDRKLRIPASNRVRNRVVNREMTNAVTQTPDSFKPMIVTEKSYKKIYQNNLRERIKNLYKNGKEMENNREEYVAESSNNRLQRRPNPNRNNIQHREQVKSDEVKDTDNLVNVPEKHHDSARIKLAREKVINPQKRLRNMLTKRISKGEPKESDINEGDKVAIEKEEYDLDQKAVETQRVSARASLDEQEKGTEERDQKINSFHQMRFWRNRFESDRLRTFLNSKKNDTGENNQSDDNKKSSTLLQRKRVSNKKETTQENTGRSTHEKDIPFLRAEHLKTNPPKQKKKKKFSSWAKNNAEAVINKEMKDIQRDWKTEDWTPLKQTPKLFVKSPNIYSISKENIENLVDKEFEIPLKTEFGSRQRRRKTPVKKKHKNVPDLSEKELENNNVTDVPKMVKTITEVQIENNLARPESRKDSEIFDVLPTPVKPNNWKGKKKVYKSQIKWINKDKTVKEVTTVASMSNLDFQEAEERTIDVDVTDIVDYNIDYTSDISKETTESEEIMKFSDEKMLDDVENFTENIKVMFDTPSKESVSHIPIYLKLPTAECPKFCIQVKVEITRLGRQLGKKCRSSVLCKKSRRR